MPLDLNKLTKFMTQAVKDTMDENISSLILADIERPRDAPPYFVIRFDQQQYKNLVQERDTAHKAFLQQNEILSLNKEILELMKEANESTDEIENNIKEKSSLVTKLYTEYYELKFKVSDCEEAIKTFEAFAEELKNQGIDSKKLPVNRGGIIQYQYFMTPSGLDQWMSERSSFYRGYRDGMSLLHLEKRDAPAYIPGRILLSPALQLDGLILLRSAGCNTSSMISTQLAFLIQDLAPQNTPQRSQFSYMYGHHYAPFAAENLGITADMIFDAMQQCLGIDRVIHHQSEDGTTELKHSEHSHYLLEPMKEDSKHIYKIFSPVRPIELDQPETRSIEVKTVDFIDELVKAMEGRVQIIREDDEYQDEDRIQKLEKGNNVLKDIKIKLSASHHNRIENS